MTRESDEQGKTREANQTNEQRTFELEAAVRHRGAVRWTVDGDFFARRFERRVVLQPVARPRGESGEAVQHLRGEGERERERGRGLAASTRAGRATQQRVRCIAIARPGREQGRQEEEGSGDRSGDETNERTSVARRPRSESPRFAPSAPGSSPRSSGRQRAWRAGREGPPPSRRRTPGAEGALPAARAAPRRAGRRTSP